MSLKPIMILLAVLTIGCGDSKSPVLEAPETIENEATVKTAAVGTALETAAQAKSHAEQHAHAHHPNELNMPPNVRQAPEAAEMVRAWAVNQELNCALRLENWKQSPGTWGILLADLAQQIANAHAEKDGATARDVLSDIQTVFNGELDSLVENEPQPEADTEKK